MITPVWHKARPLRRQRAVKKLRKQMLFSRKMKHSPLNFKIAGILSGIPGDHDNVITPPERNLVQPVSLPHKPAEMMPDHAVPDLFAHRNTEPVLIRPIFQNIHDELPVCQRCSLLVYLLKILILFE